MPVEERALVVDAAHAGHKPPQSRPSRQVRRGRVRAPFEEQFRDLARPHEIASRIRKALGAIHQWRGAVEAMIRVRAAVVHEAGHQTRRLERHGDVERARRVRVGPLVVDALAALPT